MPASDARSHAQPSHAPFITTLETPARFHVPGIAARRIHQPPASTA